MARYLAIDADREHMHIAVASVNRGVVRVEKAVTWADAGTLTAASAADVGRRLQQFLKDHNIGPAPVLVCVGRERVIVKEVKYPPCSESDEPAIVRNQVLKELTESPDDVVIDYFPLPTPEANGERRAASVVLRRDILRTFEALCLSAGLKLTALTPRPIATAAALQRAIASGAVTPVDSLSAAVAVVARGEKWGELCVVRGGEVAFTRSLSAPSLTTREALNGELRRNLALWAGQNPQTPVQAVYVAEAQSPGSGWSGGIRDGLTVPVHAFDPLVTVSTDSPAVERAAFAGLTGMFALAARSAATPINFVSPREPKPPKDPNKRIVAMVAPILVLLLVGGLGFGYMVLNEKQNKLAELKRIKISLDEDLTKYEVDEKRIKALEDWTTGGVVMADEVYDAICRFPDPAGSRVASLSFTAREPEKNSKRRFVTRLEMKVETEDARAIDRMINEMVRDGHYRVFAKEAKNTSAGFGGATRFNQTFIVRAEIEARKAGEYVRQLNVSPASRKRPGDERGVPDPDAVGFEPGVGP